MCVRIDNRNCTLQDYSFYFLDNACTPYCTVYTVKSARDIARSSLGLIYSRVLYALSVIFKPLLALLVTPKTADKYRSLLSFFLSLFFIPYAYFDDDDELHSNSSLSPLLFRLAHYHFILLKGAALYFENTKSEILLLSTLLKLLMEVKLHPRACNEKSCRKGLIIRKRIDERNF